MTIIIGTSIGTIFELEVTRSWTYARLGTRDWFFGKI